MPKLVVKNFMNIRCAEIDMAKNLVVFIGEQAGGKSTLAKLLYLFRDFIRDIQRFVRKVDFHPDDLRPKQNLSNEPDLSMVFREQIARKFRTFFGDAAPLGNFEITYHYTEESALTLTLTDEGTLHIELPAVMDEVNCFYKTLKQELLDFAFQPESDSTEDTEDGGSTLDKGSKRLFFTIKLGIGVSHISDKLAGTYCDSVFIPADRNIAVNYPDAFKRIFYGGVKGDILARDKARRPYPAANLYLMARYLEKNEELLDTFNAADFRMLFEERAKNEPSEVDTDVMELLVEKISHILKGKYGHVNEKKTLVSQPTGEGAIFLENASTGEQIVTRILQDIFIGILYNESLFRVIEGPEAYLYPTAQKHLLEIIALMLNEIESQVVITTHSPYLLAVLKNLLIAKPLSEKRSEKSPEAAAKIAARVPKACWLDADEVAVYHLKDGIAYSILDTSTEQVLPNPLADLLEEFSLDAEQL